MFPTSWDVLSPFAGDETREGMADGGGRGYAFITHQWLRSASISSIFCVVLEAARYQGVAATAWWPLRREPANRAAFVSEIAVTAAGALREHGEAHNSPPPAAAAEAARRRCGRRW